MNPTPLPTPVPTDLDIDPNRVTPGIFGFLAFAFLILAVVVLYFSMRKQLGRVDFDEGAAPGGVRPLPKYATKEERRKTALRLQKEREAAGTATSVGGAAADPLGAAAGGDTGADDSDAAAGSDKASGSAHGSGSAPESGTPTDNGGDDTTGTTP